MGYGKKWIVPVSKLTDLIANADLNNNCEIEVWNATKNVIEDSGTELWLKLATGWDDDLPTDWPDDPED